MKWSGLRNWQTQKKWFNLKQILPRKQNIFPGYMRTNENSNQTVYLRVSIFEIFIT